MVDDSSSKQDPGQTALDQKYAELEAQYPEIFAKYDPSVAADSIHRPETDIDSNFRIAEYLKHVFLKIAGLLRGEVEEVIFPSRILTAITSEEIASYETQGLVFDGIDESHPEGGIFVKGLAPSVRPLLAARAQGREVKSQHILEQIRKLTAVRATRVLQGVAGLVTEPPSEKIPDDISGLPSIPVNSMCAAVYKNNKWSKTHVFPHGRWIVPGVDNATIQYGQAGFEGMKATIFPEQRIDVVNGQIHLFRPEENARRFAKTCIRLGMPPISVNQYIEAVKLAVLRNRNFIPDGNGSLYIRPYMMGLSGGTGAKAATEYVFAVQVSPFGKYLKPSNVTAEKENTLAGISTLAVVCPRGEAGRDKAAANYSIMFAKKKAAKEKHYDDILLMEEDENGELFDTECGTSNFFVVEKEKGEDGEITFKLQTTSLTENILPGVTRKSLIELLKDPKIQQRLRRKIVVDDGGKVMVKNLKKADGAFSTGTAAGINNITSITVNDEQYSFTDEETQKFIFDLYGLLQDALKGNIEGYTDWVMKI